MKVLKKGKGSALVGTVAIAAFILLTAAGFMRVVTNESIYEALALNNDHAFAAAESGVLLGVGWLKRQDPFPGNGTFNPFPSLYVDNTGCYVDVIITITPNPVVGEPPEAQIVADAYNHPDKAAGSFQKRISYNAVVQRNIYQYAHFFHKTPNVWAGHDLRYFDGPVHINEEIYILTQDKVICTDRVTVANDPKVGWHYGDGTHHNNNYDFGVKLNNPYSGMTQSETLDLIFQNEYLANQEKIVIPDEFINLVTDLPNSTDLNKILLPKSITDEGDDLQKYSYRPTLEYFSDGSAVYSYHDGTNYSSVPIPDVHEQVIISQNNINVHGTVTGNTTLVTPYGKSIFIVGDLVYDGYVMKSDPNQSYVPSDNPNALGLVTGKHVVFNEKWIKEIGGTEVVVESDDGQLHVNASIIALMENTGGGKWLGTEYWHKSRTYAYDYYFTGNHILNEYEDPSTAGEGGGGGGANDTYYRWDMRLKDTIRPYGFPPMVGLQTQGGRYLLTLNSWTEQN